MLGIVPQTRLAGYLTPVTHPQGSGRIMCVPTN